MLDNNAVDDPRRGSTTLIFLSGVLMEPPFYLFREELMKEIDAVKEILSPVLEKEGYSLASVTLVRETDGLTLHVFIDRDEPISLDDIVLVSNIINPILDKEDPISSSYTLDVSSLGAEKPIGLEKLEKYIGSYVNLHLSNPYKGENALEGDLLEVKEEELTLGVREKSKTKKVILKRADIDKARLAIKF